MIVKDSRIRPLGYLILIIFPISMGLLALAMGRIYISPLRIIDFFIAYLGGHPYDPVLESVLINVRLSRLLTALLVGAGLSVAGLCFQSIFKNPLATPDILGVSQSASLGAVLAIVLSLGSLLSQVLAMAFSLLGLILCLSIGNKKNSLSLILSGLVVSSLANAFLTLIKYTADPYDKLPEISYWLMGSFSKASFKNILIGGAFIGLGIIIIKRRSLALNILSLSDDEAESLGLDIKKTRTILILGASLITGSSIALCGQIGFIGLIIPHIARLIVGLDSRLNLPVTMSLGAGAMAIIEALARTISVIEIPISVLTAIIAAPVFISLIRKSFKEGL